MKGAPLTRYTELRHAGYYTDGLTDAERAKIAAQVDGKPQPKTKATTTAKTGNTKP